MSGWPDNAPATSVDACVAVVCDAVVAVANVGLPWIVQHAAATYRAVVGAVPAHYAAAAEMAEDYVGIEDTDAIAVWVGQRIWAFKHVAAGLDELRELTPPACEIPAQARAAGATASMLEAAAGGRLAEVIWSGACATVQWTARYAGEDEQLVEAVVAQEPIVAAAGLRLCEADQLRICAGVQSALAQIDELAGIGRP